MHGTNVKIKKYIYLKIKKYIFNKILIEGMANSFVVLGSCDRAS